MASFYFASFRRLGIPHHSKHCIFCIAGVCKIYSSDFCKLKLQFVQNLVYRSKTNRATLTFPSISADTISNPHFLV